MRAALHATWTGRLGNEFDPFLFAPIAEESNGMQRTVVSVLARLDVDPWEEAANMARLPGESATRRLAALLEALPVGLMGQQDSGLIAARLVALLPRPTRSPAPAPQSVPGLQPGSRSRAVTAVILYAVFMMFLLSAQWLMANRDRPVAAHDSSAPVTTAVTPTALTPR